MWWQGWVDWRSQQDQAPCLCEDKPHPPTALCPAPHQLPSALLGEGWGEGRVGLSPPEGPLGPGFTASYVELRGFTAAAVPVQGGTAREPEGIITGIGPSVPAPFCSARCRTQRSALPCPH